jgi:hypothetical protein
MKPNPDIVHRDSDGSSPENRTSEYTPLNMKPGAELNTVLETLGNIYRTVQKDTPLTRHDVDTTLSGMQNIWVHVPNDRNGVDVPLHELSFETHPENYIWRWLMGEDIKLFEDDEITYLPPYVAERCARHWLALPKVKHISPATSHAIRNNPNINDVIGIGIITISAEVADDLVHSHASELRLHNITHVDTKVASILAKFKGNLYLGNIAPAPLSVFEELAHFKGDMLALDVQTISASEIALIASCEHLSILDLQYLRTLPLDVASSLQRCFRGNYLNLESVQTLTPEVVKCLVGGTAKNFDLGFQDHMTPEAAKGFQGFTGALYIRKTKKLPEQVFRAFSVCTGLRLTVGQDEPISDELRTILEDPRKNKAFMRVNNEILPISHKK